MTKFFCRSTKVKETPKAVVKIHQEIKEAPKQQIQELQVTSKPEQTIFKFTPEAFYNIGVRCKEQGEISKARDCYNKAAEMGHPGAIRELGVLCEFIDKNVSEAKKYYQIAAEKNDHVAKKCLIKLEREEESARNGPPIEIEGKYIKIILQSWVESA